MNRRDAIQRITMVAAGFALLPGCDVESVPVFENIPLDRKQWNLFRHLSEAVLPVDHALFPVQEPRANFILTILNDCTPQEDLEEFLKGFQVFQSYMEEEDRSPMPKMEAQELDDLIAYLEESEKTSMDLSQFYFTTKSLAQEHLLTSERFMEDHLDFKFVPGFYEGCITIN